MKKLIVFVTAVTFGLGTVACSSDDNASNSYKDDLQGAWKEAKIFYLDKDKKVISEEFDDNDGCGSDEIEFKGNMAFATYFYKDYLTKECESEKESTEYSLEGNTISVILTEDGETYRHSSTITTLNKTKLVIETKQDIEEESSDEVVYVQIEYNRK